ncbi:MAG: M13 family metallopeptidase [Planctomycetes bacterium]|nr:M13 family metallopeptidase [Planctomycetota bacterium]MCP4770166.1 M13 family metallopeptidase [Planctomycetota bacterium]MCP4860686.1 M13 family metallopeptidase [Planctomycetota bacterium]
MKLALRTSIPLALLVLTACAAPETKDECCNGCESGLGQDFYSYVNQDWLDANPIPEAYGSYGVFHQINDGNKDVLHQILLDAADHRQDPGTSHLDRQLGRMWATGMDADGAEAQGTKAIRPLLERINLMNSRESFAKMVGHLHLINVNVMFGLGAEADFSDSTMSMTFIAPDGLGLPEKAYYFRDDEESELLREQYVAHMANMFELLGHSGADAQNAAERVMALELKLAEHTLGALEYRNPAVLANKITASEMTMEIIPGFDWATYFGAIGVDQQEFVNLVGPGYFEALDGLLAEVTMEDWKTYMSWHLLTTSAPYMASAFVDEDFDFFSRKLSGTPANRERWERVLGSVNGAMGEGLGQAFVAQTFSPEAKTLAETMVKDLLAAYRVGIDELDWMTDTTKVKALEKLSAFNVKIGYPDEWRDYSMLDLSGDSWLENVLIAREFNNRFNLAKIGKPVDKNEWGMSPQTVNAYYHPLHNEIVFPAAILQPPFFGLEQSLAENYGSMGAIIGHEITHGFDDMGSQFDAQGNMSNWWTDEDRAEFEKRAAVLVEQFNNYLVVDDLYVNGELTLGENIADLGGLKMAFAAFQMRSEMMGGLADVDGLTPAQQFFTAWARSWRQNSRDESLKLQVNTDPHSPEKFRANGPLGNLPEFAEAFGLTSDAAMIREASDRASIW